MSNKLALVSRILLGLVFTVFGLNGFLNFIPMKQAPSEQMMKFATALQETGYMFPLVKGLEVVCGLALLSGFFVPLALTLLAPIIVNIVLIHTLLEPSGAPMAIAILALELFLAWHHRAAFAPMLKAK